MKVDKKRMMKKALLRGAQFAAVALTAMNTVPIPEGVGVSRQVTITFGIAVLGAVGKAIHNYIKISRKPVVVPSCYILALAGLAATLTGCVTTTAPDGTVTTSVDHDVLQTALERYDALQARKAALEAEKARADAARQAEIIAALHELEPQIRDAARRIGLAEY